MSRNPLSPSGSSPAPDPAGSSVQARNVPDLIRALWARPLVRLAIYAVLAPLLLWGILRMSGLLASVLVTVFLAYGLAFLCNPLLTWLERHRVGRMVGVLLLLVLGISLVTAVVMTVSSQINGMLSSVPELARSLKAVVITLLDRLDSLPGTEGLKESLTTYIDREVEDITQNAGPLAERLLSSGPTVLKTLSNLVGWLGQVGFIVTLAMYFMIDYDGIGRSMLQVLPRSWQPTALQLSEDVSESFGAYLRGSLLMLVACVVLATTGLLLLKVPNALAIGLLSGIINLFPYVGIVLASILAMFQAIPMGTTTILLVAGLYFLINQLLGNVIGPLIMGRTMHLSAAAILIALLIGLALGGVGGALLAIPFATLLKRWMQRYWLPSRTHQGHTMAPTPPSATSAGSPQAQHGQGPVG
ncbi:AI-2E family transporter [Deinococcus malanensis]|uniref:AI-2E family transporter n=1 Tax=Deinococcus malanensis TaxID=1706855 RepID=UPI0016684A46|nr:AI-2E family transporter [Deinococcus malanensis]